MLANSPGKILFYGGYSVLIRGHSFLTFAVVDKQGKGVYANASKGDERLIAKQFDLDFRPSLEDNSLINYAYLVGKHYLLAKNAYVPATIELTNSHIFGKDEEKSGLGSSAGATATTIKALFAVSGFSPSFHKETIFKLSQLAYALYSHKIGSGFDIASAVQEQTIIYERYNPDQLKLPETLTEEFLSLIPSLIDRPWEWVKTIPFKVPEKYDILFFNIKEARTSTISSVKSFKKLKKENPELLNSLMEQQDQAEKKAINALKESNDEDIRKYTHKAREVHKILQQEAKGLPIEPEELTNIIDEAENIPSVVAGRAPGAGGYDGLAFIVHKNTNQEELAKRIIDIAKEYSIDMQYIPLRIL